MSPEILNESSRCGHRAGSEKAGSVCGECGRTVTFAEYSIGGSICCKADIIPVEYFGRKDVQLSSVI